MVCQLRGPTGLLPGAPTAIRLGAATPSRLIPHATQPTTWPGCRFGGHLRPSAPWPPRAGQGPTAGPGSATRHAAARPRTSPSPTCPAVTPARATTTSPSDHHFTRRPPMPHAATARLTAPAGPNHPHGSCSAWLVRAVPGRSLRAGSAAASLPSRSCPQPMPRHAAPFSLANTGRVDFVALLTTSGVTQSVRAERQPALTCGVPLIIPAVRQGIVRLRARPVPRSRTRSRPAARRGRCARPGRPGRPWWRGWLG